MIAELSTAPAKASAHTRSIRRGSLQGMVGPTLALLYLLSTGSQPHRPAMTAIAGSVFVLNFLAWATAAQIAHLRWPLPIQIFSIGANFAGSSVLTLLDGGIASPLGALVPFSLLILAVMVPPRIFIAVSCLSGLAYWSIAVWGGPAPPGYALMYTLMFGGVGVLCLRHAGALASLRHRLNDVSRMDPLTKCLNRRGFDERFEQELAQAIRTGDPLTLVLADLDGFKQVNDTYGHQVGDQLLAWTTRILARHLRGHDTVGRLGGDEFAAVLADTGPEGGLIAVERVREALQVGSPASFGYACYPTDATTCEGLKHHADRRLYADKTSREHRPPTAEAVAAARSIVIGTGETRVSPRERRRRGVTDMGRLTVFDNGVGIIYALLFAGGRAHQLAVIVLLTLSLIDGVAMLAFAARLSLWSGARYFMITNAVVCFVIAAVAVVLDGGVHSPIALGLLVPMTLIALATPIQRTWPLLALVSGAYVGVGLTVGPSDGWYVALHLGGALVASIVCGLTGRAAAEQRALLHRLSRVDELTDCLNRRGFEDRFVAELAHARRTSRPIALVILDLDGFKQVNDQFGHAAGDNLLIWVADTLRRVLHPHDVVGRLGGDEFVVLLTSADAVPFADAVQEALAERTAVCAGVAVLDQHGQDFDQLYAHADEAMYAQKVSRGTTRRATSPRPGTAPNSGSDPSAHHAPSIPSPRLDETPSASGITSSDSDRMHPPSPPSARS